MVGPMIFRPTPGRFQKKNISSENLRPGPCDMLRWTLSAFPWVRRPSSCAEVPPKIRLRCARLSPVARSVQKMGRCKGEGLMETSICFVFWGYLPSIPPVVAGLTLTGAGHGEDLPLASWVLYSFPSWGCRAFSRHLDIYHGS